MIEKVVFMNMCMISDNKGNVLALDKVGKNYSGTTFPGGHVEAKCYTCHLIATVIYHC